MMRKETLPRFPKRCTRTCSASRSISRDADRSQRFCRLQTRYLPSLPAGELRTNTWLFHAYVASNIRVVVFARIIAWSWPDRTVSRMTRWSPDVGNFDKEDDERELWSSKMMKDEIVRSCVRHVPCDMLLTYCSVLRITYRSENSGVRIYMYHWD